MKPPKLMSRILSALALQSMTYAELRRCLDMSENYPRILLEGMVSDGAITVDHVRRRSAGRPQFRYAVVSSAGGMKMCAPSHNIPKSSS